MSAQSPAPALDAALQIMNVLHLGKKMVDLEWVELRGALIERMTAAGAVIDTPGGQIAIRFHGWTTTSRTLDLALAGWAQLVIIIHQTPAQRLVHVVYSYPENYALRDLAELLADLSGAGLGSIWGGSLGHDQTGGKLADLTKGPPGAIHADVLGIYATGRSACELARNWRKAAAAKVYGRAA